jgi:mannose-6-phosphate isomerase-like protein (cupin superfamily)
MVLQGPGITYPPHVHKAVEVYWVLAGTADWQKGDEWSTHGPGTVILHDTGVRHATTTRSEPQLLFFAWVTDPGCATVIVRL